MSRTQHMPGETPHFGPAVLQKGICQAVRSTDGEPCKRRAIAGGTVCTFHGGASPDAQRMAKLRLLAMVDVAFQCLMDAMTAPDRHWPSAVKACELIMDRAGFGPKSTVAFEGLPSTIDPNASKEQMLVRLGELQDQLKAQMLLEATPPPLLAPMPESNDDKAVH